MDVPSSRPREHYLGIPVQINPCFPCCSHQWWGELVGDHVDRVLGLGNPELIVVLGNYVVGRVVWFLLRDCCCCVTTAGLEKSC